MLHDVNYLLLLINCIIMPDSKSIATGAATGAAVGTGISPGVGTVIGAGIGAVGSLLGGVLGKKSQQKANKTNLQIAREQNETQKQLAAENNRLQREMFERQLFYNSPGAQRKMLEDAGLNPYSMIENGYQALSAPNAPQMQLPAFTTPQVNPENAFAQNLGTVGKDFGEVMRNLSEAGLFRSQKTTNDINNITQGAKNAQELRALGLGNEAQEMENEVYRDTLQAHKDEQIAVSKLRMQEARAEFYKAGQERIRKFLLDKFGDKLQKAQIDNILAQTNLLDTQVTTEVFKQSLLHKQGIMTEKETELLPRKMKVAEVMAQADVKKAEAALRSANAALTTANATANYLRLKGQEQAEINKMVKKTREWFDSLGYTKLDAELERIQSDAAKNTATAGQLNALRDLYSSMIPYYQNQAELIGKRSDWFIFDEGLNAVNTILGAQQKAIQGAGTLAPLLMP